jgi:amino acid permease
MLPIVLMFTVLGRLDILAYTSALGNVAVAAGICAVLVDSAATPRSKPITPVPAASAAGLGSFAGSTSFLFAIHIIALPVIEGVSKARRRLAVNAAFAIVTLVNLAFAMAVVALAGAGVSSNVVDDLGQGGALLAVKLLLVVDLVATMPVVLLAAVKVAERALRLSTWPRYASLAALAVRSLAVATSFAIAFAVPDFGKLVSIVGGVVSCGMGFVLPPLLFIAVTGKVSPQPVLIALIGVAAMVVTLYQSISAA